MNTRNRTPRRVRSGFVPASLISLLLAGALLTATQPAARADALSRKGDNFLRRTHRPQIASGWASVIVQLDGDLTARHEAQLRALGADICRHLPFIRSVALRVPTRNLSRLAALPFVLHVSSDASVKKSDEFTVASSGADVAFQQYNLTGQGIGVAIVDSGVNESKDLKDDQSRIVHRVSFVSGTRTTDDGCGHGTHVAGIVAGNGRASSGPHCFRTFYGIARRANIINVRVLDDNGAGDVSSVLAAIQWVISKQAKYNIRVMNLSLGHPVGESYTTDPLCQAVEAAWKAGIVVVCAAGNEGRLNDKNTPGLDNEGWGTAYGSIQSPGNDPYVITVGAMKSTDGNRADDTIATYSSRGPSRLDLVLKPDIVAPGNQVISLQAPESFLTTAYGGTNLIPLSYYRTAPDGDTSRRYFRLSGTSMAAPVVAGAAALLLQADPSLSPDTVKTRLMLSADKWSFPDGSTDPCTFGAGYLDIPAALQCDVVATQYAMSPSLSEDDAGNVYVNVDNSGGNGGFWGTGIGDLHAIWGHNALWGGNTLSSSHAIWGKSVWSDHAIWGTGVSVVDLSSIAIDGE